MKETQEDSTRIKSHPTTTKPRKQAKKDDVRDCSKKQSICTQLAEGHHAYIRDCQEKNRVYVSKTMLRTKYQYSIEKPQKKYSTP
jgi:hypothetical protein